MSLKKVIQPLIVIGIIILVSYNPVKKETNFIKLADNVIPFRDLSNNNRIYGTGSYIRFLGKSFILSNRHVCNYKKKGKSIQVDNTINKIIAISSKYDLCLLETDKNIGLKISKKRAKPLEEIVLIGFPRGIGKIIRKGAVVKDERLCIMYPKGIRCVDSTRISALAYGGNSGSPVLNSKGEVVNVLYAGSNQYPHEPYTVKYSQIMEFLIEYAR